MRRLVLAGFVALYSTSASAQVISQRGFIDLKGIGFVEAAPNDSTRRVADMLAREEVTLRPARWFQFSGGLDLRFNSHDQTEDEWRLDFKDQGILRPRAAVRKMVATVNAGPFSVAAGKQFIRWGRGDIISPTDMFAPRDYLNVLESDFLPVLAVRPSLELGRHTFEGVWSPRFTPSRLPLYDQRWVVLPGAVEGIEVQDAGTIIPRRRQLGARWRFTGERIEAALSVYDGFQHLPTIVAALDPSQHAAVVTRVHPRVRMFGGDMALPTGLVTLKTEIAYMRAPDHTSDDYVLYVIEIERQTGEWLLGVGYAGDKTTRTSFAFPFAPDRGLAHSMVGRASYTVNPRRTIAVEGALQEDGDGYYAKLEWSQVLGRHWRFTLAGVGIGGDDHEFLGQYRHNSNGTAALRLSF